MISEIFAQNYAFALSAFKKRTILYSEQNPSVEIICAIRFIIWHFIFSRSSFEIKKMEANTSSETSTADNMKHFRLVYVISQLVGLTIVILTIVWVFGYLGGLSWSSTPKTQFNWHPLLNIIGMIYLFGNCEHIQYFSSNFSTLMHFVFPL